jgi:preprotein translocase subunit Sec63
VEAGSKGLIDQTYFKATAEFRKRAGLLLEAALRTAIALQSYRLAKTIIEAVTMFKIGTLKPIDPQTIQWFEGIMNRQYGCMPKVSLSNLKVFTDDEDEIATNDTCTLEMDIDRLHAENFTKQKIAMCQKQGIPPQVALQTYREGWWVMVRAEKLDGGQLPAIEYNPVNDQMKTLLSNVDVEAFSAEEQENRLLTAWPLIVQNCAQKSGKIKLHFKAPSVPGKYRFHIAVMSQEFLGADQELTCERTVVDEATVKRPEEEDEGDEAKKDK